MQGWRKVADASYWILVQACRVVFFGKSGRALRPRRDVVDFGPEVSDPMLTRKAAKR